MFYILIYMYILGILEGILFVDEDRNLKKDGFFQEKISSEPEPGWLELRWIMQLDVQKTWLWCEGRARALWSRAFLSKRCLKP